MKQRKHTWLVWLSSIVLVAGYLLAPLGVSAIIGIDEPLIPCGLNDQGDCTFCHFFELIQNIYNFLIFVIVPPVAVVMIAIGGFFWLTAGGSLGRVQHGHKIILAVLAGLVIIYVSWLVISFGISLIARNIGIYDPAKWYDPTSWFALQCEAAALAAAGPTGQGAHFPDDDDPFNPPSASDPTGPLPVGCASYESDFQAIGAATGVPACLLEAIAAAESSCNPNAQSPQGSCGLMQLLPSTAGVSCSELKSNPQLSIQLAANYLQTSAAIIGGYSGLDIGNSFTQSGTTVSYGSNVYDTGNDDLIASYNAGWGAGCGSPKQAFCQSVDCPSPPTPAWQCHINPGGFAETQIYVQRVQDYQDQCEAS